MSILVEYTQMSIALAEWLLHTVPSRMGSTKAREIAIFFFNAFGRDPRRGYSRRMYKGLSESSDVDEFLKRLDTDSTRSGAAMRSAVLGVLQKQSDVVRIAALQAAITHNTKEGIASSVAVATVAWWIRNGANVSDALEQAQLAAAPWIDIDWCVLPNLPVSYHGVPCVQAALYALKLHFDDPCTMIKTIISYGGDTDTVAAIAVGIRSMAPNPIVWPAWCNATLENGPFGLDFLQNVDAQLKMVWPALDPH